MAFHTLTASAFHSALSPVSTKGVNPLFRGKIKINGDVSVCYIKPMVNYVETNNADVGGLVENREVANEAIGYLLATGFDLPVASDAGFIVLEQSSIPSDVLAHPAMTCPQMQDKQAVYLCWFSKDMNAPQLTAWANRQDVPQHKAVQWLKDMPKTPEVLAFDDWLRNSDRHAGNLLKARNGMVLIDHGRILVFPDWAPGELGKFFDGHQLENRLEKLIKSIDPSWLTSLPVKNARMMAYRGFELTLAETSPVLREHLGELFESDDVDKIISLLGRLLNPTDYQSVVGLIA